MQPVQDLTIDSSVSRAQYHFILQDADPNAFKIWVPKLVQRLRQLPELSDVASDMQSQGLAVDLTIDRATAARFGITPASVDNALYDAFGQRIISTIYTQSNQYRVILEADPALQRALSSLSSFYLPSSSSSTNGQVPLSAIVHVSERLDRSDHPSRAVSRHHHLLQCRAEAPRLAPPSRPSRRPSERLVCPIASSHPFKARPRRFAPRRPMKFF